MDSISQIALGAAVAGLVAGTRATPKVLLAGALLGTLPDLDVFLKYDDPITNMIKHRGFSHSVFVLLPLSGVMALFAKHVLAKNWPLRQLFLLISGALLTHPLLDSFTSYGTQLFWPIKMQPIAISSMYIVDPLYTFPLLIPVIVALFWRKQSARLCGIGLGLSSLYLLWSLFSLAQIKERVDQSIAGTPLENLPVFISPTPFNTLLWRVVVLGEAHYWEGLSSLLDKKKDIQWMEMDRGKWPFETKPKLLNDLNFFTGGFVRYRQEGDHLIATDLRLGIAIYHPFSFIVAQKDNEQGWVSVLPERRKSNTILPQHIPALWLRFLGGQNIDPMLCKQK